MGAGCQTRALALAALSLALVACRDPDPIDGGVLDAGGDDGGALGDAGARDGGDRDDASRRIDGGPPGDAGAGGEMFAVELERDGTNIDGEDEITITCDDAVAGPEGHRACDVGAGSFTFELWMRGDASRNANTSSVGLDMDRPSYDWIEGNIFLDRDVYGGSCDGRDFGASVIDGRVSFGVGQTPTGGPLTLYGSATVVETPAQWHHVALVYDDSVNRLRIYVDGALDAESTTTISDADRSIPDEGCTRGSARSAQRQVELAIGTEKHGFGAISFDGRIARIRIWDVARAGPDIAAGASRVVPCATPGLVGRYDLEEGAGSVARDACARAPDAAVALGSRGLSRWIEDGPALAL